MATTVVNIFNQAMVSLGARGTIVSEGEDSNEAQALRDVYPDTRDGMLVADDWPFAERYSEVLSPFVADPPSSNWQYWFPLPEDVLRVREVIDGTVRPTEPIPFVVFNDPNDGDVLMCDIKEPKLRYTAKIVDVRRFPPDFINALQFLLAAKVALRVTAEPRVQQGMFESYQRSISAARTNMPGIDPPPEDSTFIAARL